MSYLIRFEDDAALNPKLVGYKFYSLARAARRGHSVPPAFAIITEAHHHFLKQNRWPRGLLSEVLTAADELELENGISIRSSATSEDLENQSFAGQYRTFLEVVSRADLKAKIEQCWKSVNSDTVKSYLKAATHGTLTDEPPTMAVVLQKMVHPTTAGVAFGKNPMRPDRDEIVIEAVSGLADDLVSGRTSPYRATISSDGQLSVAAPGARSPRSGDRPPLLQRQQWLNIGALLRRLEAQHRSGPLDIEWAIDHEDRLWLLQSRAITALESAVKEVPPGVWTRKIADDLWADRLTPFLAHLMMRNSPRFDMSRYAKRVGLKVKRPTLAIIDGYLYVNCDNLKNILAMLPRRFRSTDLMALLPRDDQRLPDVTAPQTLAVIIRGLMLGAVIPAANPLLCLRVTGKRQKKLEAKIDQIDRMRADHIADACAKVLAASECVAQIQENNQWPYAFAAMSMWMSRWWVVDQLGHSNAVFFKYLHRGVDNVAIRIERQVKEMARQLHSVEDSVLKESSDAVFDQLPPDFKQQFDQFIAQYGCRASQRTLYLKRWAEEPRQVLQLMALLSRGQLTAETRSNIASKRGVDSAMDGAGGAHEPDRSPMARRRDGSIPRGLTRWLLQLTRLYLDRREDLRFLLDRCLFVLRQALLDLGRLTGLNEDVLFLDTPEIERLVDGRLDIDAAKSRAEQRHRKFLQPLPVSPFYIDGRPYGGNEEDDRKMTGIGTSPGRSAGFARVVTDPTLGSIQKGDILVARSTDPGWTPILGHVGGVIVEEGGLLNHCSIVARELGIPAVVGVSGATHRIADGSRITIDGDLGIVYIDAAATEHH